MAVTIKDVARLANVSPSTVSRVLSNSNMISEETKERVRKAVKELKYYPHAIARSLANKETKTIGLILHSSAEQAFVNPFFPEIIRGISKILTAEGYYMLLSTSKNDNKENEALIRLSSERRVDGLVLLTSWIDDDIVRELTAMEFPTVVVGEPSKDIKVDWVDNNNKDSAYAAVEHLIENGFDKIAFLGVSYRLMVTAQRLKGYINALVEHNIEVQEEYFKECEFNNQIDYNEIGYNEMKELLALPNPPNAVLCGDDTIVQGAIKAIKEAGLKIPDEFGVLGFNTIRNSSISPAITVMDLDVINLGKNAARMLLDRIKHPEAETKSLIIPTKFVPRESTVRGD